MGMSFTRVILRNAGVFTALSIERNAIYTSRFKGWTQYMYDKGMYIRVDVTTRTKKESVIETKPQYFDVAVRAKAERNEANVRVKELLARHFGVSVGVVRIINGHHNPRKLIDIRLNSDSQKDS